MAGHGSLADTNHQQTEGVPLGIGELHVSTGDHIGHFYETREEWAEVLGSFLKTGLEAGEKCVYLMSPGPGERQMRTDLAKGGIDVDKELGAGQLVFHKGTDEPKELRDSLDQCLAEIPGKYPRLRWGGDMTWSLGRIPTTETLMEWETHCNTLDSPPAIFL